MKRLSLSLVAVMLIVLASCKSSNTNQTQLNIKITDAIGDYEAIVLNIKEINVKTSNGTNT
jgi:nitrous oxide reductase accessory protein NosL